MADALIELVGDTDRLVISGPVATALDEAIILDKSPSGIFGTGFTMKTVSGASQIGGREAARPETPVREITIALDCHDIGQGVVAQVSRVRKMFGSLLHRKTVEWRYTTDYSGLRWLKVKLSRDIEFSPEQDWESEGYAHAVVSLAALEPRFESASTVVSWSNPSAGSHTGYLPTWNPTDQDMFLDWTFDPATQWQFPDFSFGLERKYRRPANADANRMIVMGNLTQKLSVMADPMMDTYILADQSNWAGVMGGVEPIYWVPPYTGTQASPILLPVVCNGPAGASVVLKQRRLWSAESGLE